MAIVRELITLLGTQVDTTGFQQYEKGLSRLKELAINTGKIFGLVFAADKVIAFADGLVSAGKEINRIRAQLNNVARPIDDMNAAQTRARNIAQELGLAYKDVFSTFKDFHNEMLETQVPTENILETTRNIFKALQIDRATPERIQQTLDLFDRSFKRGSFRSVGIGQLQDLSPRAYRILAEHLETNEEGLRKLAKEGKITADVIIQAFSQASSKLQADWEKVPRKLDKVFENIYTDLVSVTAEIYKIIDASAFMGRIVWSVWVSFRTGVIRVVEVLGGLQSTLELIGIALAVIFGPRLLAMLAQVTVATIAWAAANVGVLLTYGAMAAAIIAVVLAIQDVIYWVQGKKNWIGTWVGPFEDLAENFKKLDIFAGFRAIGDLFTGDFEGFKKEFDIFVNSTEAQLLMLTSLVGGVFAAWKTWKFAELLLELLKVKTAVTEVGKAAEAATAVGKTPGAAPPGASPGGKPPVSGFLPLLGSAGVATGALTLGIFGEGWIQDAFDWILGRTDEEKRVRADREATLKAEGRKAFFDFLGSLPGILFRKGDTSTPSDLYLPQGGTPGQQYLPQNFTPGGAWAPPPGALLPVTPGPVTNNVQPTFHQNVGGITVNASLDGTEIGNEIGNRLNKLMNEKVGGWSREIQNSAPRVEAATS